MKKIILKPKIKFTSELNLKNLSNINFEVKKIFGTKVLYKNKEHNLSELFEVEINKNNKDQNELIIKIKQAANISKVKYQNITNQSYEFTIYNFDKKKMINKTISFYRSI